MGAKSNPIEEFANGLEAAATRRLWPSPAEARVATAKQGPDKTNSAALEARFKSAATTPTLGSEPSTLGVHPIYALLWELTGVYDVFRKLLAAYLNGELRVDDEQAQHWLWETECLFYKDRPPESALAITNSFQTDVEAVRWQVYYRLFGARDGIRGIPALHGGNTEFPRILDGFLREVATVIGRPDQLRASVYDDRIAGAAKRLRASLQHARTAGQARAIFAAGAAMSRFDIALAEDSPIVVALGAQGHTRAERLDRIGARVGRPPDPRTRDLIALAAPLEHLLTLVETEAFDDVSGARQTYDLPVIRNWMETIRGPWAALSRASRLGADRVA